MTPTGIFVFRFHFDFYGHSVLKAQHTFFQQNPPLGHALLLKSEIHYISINLDREMDFPYSVVKIDVTSHFFLRSSHIDYISIFLSEMSLNIYLKR